MSNAIILPALGWKCRPYQVDAWNYMTSDDGRNKFAVLNWHRRAGKDFFLLNLIAYMTTRRRGMYWHAFPQLKQGKKAIWEDFTSEGQRKLDYIPNELRADVNQQELRIALKTGSTYMIVGGDDPDRNLGSGPVGVGFSEYSTMSPKMWDLISPMLAENHGWAIFISTPRGKNHFYDLYKYAEKSAGCFAQTLTIDDTWHFDVDGKKIPVIDQTYLKRERDMGKSEDFIRQEYYGDFSSSVDGAIFGREMQRMESEGRITDVPIDHQLPVKTCWDLGYRDTTVAIFYQEEPGGAVRIFDLLFDSNQPISYYCGKVKEKPYRYERHIGPWDLGHRTIATGNSTMDYARQNGINFFRCPRHHVDEGNDALRALLNRAWIDKTKCSKLIDALKAYRYEYDDDRQVFKDTPEHDWASHFADALRQGAFMMPRSQSVQNQIDVLNLENQRPRDIEDAGWVVLN